MPKQNILPSVLWDGITEGHTIAHFLLWLQFVLMRFCRLDFNALFCIVFLYFVIYFLSDFSLD